MPGGLPRWLLINIFYFFLEYIQLNVNIIVVVGFEEEARGCGSTGPHFKNLVGTHPGVEWLIADDVR
jgi:hypothetical protein